MSEEQSHPAEQDPSTRDDAVVLPKKLSGGNGDFTPSARDDAVLLSRKQIVAFVVMLSLLCTLLCLLLAPDGSIASFVACIIMGTILGVFGAVICTAIVWAIRTPRLGSMRGMYRSAIFFAVEGAVVVVFCGATFNMAVDNITFWSRAIFCVMAGACLGGLVGWIFERNRGAKK